MRSFVLALACAAGFSASALGTVSFSLSNGSRAATADFTVDGTSLKVRLTNTSAADALVPTDLLTAIFFNISNPAVTLTPSSAVLAPGSTIFGAPAQPSSGVVGGEWAYRGATTLANGFGYGISSTGLGDFGPGDRFPGDNLSGPTSPDGPQYGITTAGDNPATGNGGLNTEIIHNSVNFVLTGLPVGFAESRITGARFQYGTDYAEPSFPGTLVPAPGAAALLGLGGLVMARRRR
ncbi:MAG: XDD4 family exosortase-dependent surface protein [Phycisphaerales bacterium]|jgi:hypothetical protein